MCLNKWNCVAEDFAAMRSSLPVGGQKIQPSSRNQSLNSLLRNDLARIVPSAIHMPYNLSDMMSDLPVPCAACLLHPARQHGLLREFRFTERTHGPGVTHNAAR